MGASSIILGFAGVRGCAVGDRDGRILEHAGTVGDAPAIADIDVEWLVGDRGAPDARKRTRPSQRRPIEKPAASTLAPRDVGIPQQGSPLERDADRAARVGSPPLDARRPMLLDVFQNGTAPTHASELMETAARLVEQRDTKRARDG